MTQMRLPAEDIACRRERDECDREFARQQVDMGIQGPLAEKTIGFAARYDRYKKRIMRKKVEYFLATASPQLKVQLASIFPPNVGSKS